MLKGNLPLILSLWMAIIGLMFIARKRKNVAGAGLVLAYLLNLWMIYWAASLTYVLPWYRGSLGEFTIAGTEQSLYAVAAFAFGSLVFTPFLLDMGIFPRPTGVHHADPRLPKVYLAAGAIFYVLLTTPFGRLPTVTAIVSAGQELAVAGLGLCWWQAWKTGNRAGMRFWIVVSFLPPVLTVVTRGFLGYGAIATLSVLIFVSNFARSRVRLVIVAVLLGYLALSVYVTYKRDRGEIRASVWGGHSVSNTMQGLDKSIRTFEWFDPFNQDHLSRVDERLNQSYLVGAAVARLRETGDFARGETLYDAFLAMVPRVLWPDKPITAGSNNLVTRFTGIIYAGNTSVGIGPVMEFYVNFGTTGVVIGFLILGVMVTLLDILATERLAFGDLNGFVLFFIPGLGFLQVGGQLVEVTASAAAGVVVVLGVNRFLHRMQSKAPVSVQALASSLRLQPRL